MRALTQSEYQIRGYNLDFTYGQFNLNYPNTEIKNDFVLDYDCYTSSLTDSDDLIKFLKKCMILLIYYLRIVLKRNYL